MELGASPAELGSSRADAVGMDGWEPVARAREDAEVRRYEAMLAGSLDEPTAALVREILDTERHHAEELGGKWTRA